MRFFRLSEGRFLESRILTDIIIFAIQFHITSYCITSQCFILFCFILHCINIYYIISHCFKSYYIILHYIIFCICGTTEYFPYSDKFFLILLHCPLLLQNFNYFLPFQILLRCACGRRSCSRSNVISSCCTKGCGSKRKR